MIGTLTALAARRRFATTTIGCMAGGGVAWWTDPLDLTLGLSIIVVIWQHKTPQAQWPLPERQRGPMERNMY